MVALKITTIGNSMGVILPKEVLESMKLSKGDTIHLTQAPDGFRITPANPEFDEQMKVAREVMKRRRAVLRELAK
ncbi:MAG: AbrB/MazE/SpoVT family DNA-binding domain-containing protein [Rhodospirillaceae bacterium]|nr:AbrB/MazE/SpoVT family DNA-binding domain-containing protein [Rhodospirillaceae bacterium]